MSQQKNKWKGQVKSLEQQNTNLSNMYEDMLMKYTEVYEESNKYKNLSNKYKTLYLNLQSNSKSQQFLFKKNDTQFLNTIKVALKHDHNSIPNYNPQYDALYRKYQCLQSEHRSLECVVSKMKKENEEQMAIIEQLNKDLSSAQHDILEMTSTVGVKQSFPTVQETLTQFHNIRDQQHHNTSSKLRKYIKAKGEKYQKYYINQVIHEFMFKTLLQCHKKVSDYKDKMFERVADELNMPYTLRKIACTQVIYDSDDSDQEEDKEEDHEAFIHHETVKILGNRLGSYFRDNYQYVLKVEALKSNVMNDMLSDDVHFSDLQKANNAMECYAEYVRQCIEVCWIMQLQEPVLKLMPLQWRDGRVRKYDDTINKRALGSDRKCNVVLYYIWPCIVRNDSRLKNQKTEVVTKNALYTPYKVKK